MNKNLDQLLIIGAGGHGKVLSDIAMNMYQWKRIAFLDDNSSVQSIMGLEIIGNINSVFQYCKDFDIFVGIGNQATRKKLMEELMGVGAHLPTLIHPNSVIGRDVEIGMGTVIMPGVVINCCTRMGIGCIINTGSTVDHDNVIGDYVHISPGVHTAGKVTIGNNTWLGIGSIIKNNINISSDCIIGAGAVVIKDIVASGTYIGIPARRMEV